MGSNSRHTRRGVLTLLPHPDLADCFAHPTEDPVLDSLRRVFDITLDYVQDNANARPALAVNQPSNAARMSDMMASGSGPVGS